MTSGLPPLVHAYHSVIEALTESHKRQTESLEQEVKQLTAIKEDSLRSPCEMRRQMVILRQQLIEKEAKLDAAAADAAAATAKLDAATARIDKLQNKVMRKNRFIFLLWANWNTTRKTATALQGYVADLMEVLEDLGVLDEVRQHPLCPAPLRLNLAASKQYYMMVYNKQRKPHYDEEAPFYGIEEHLEEYEGNPEKYYDIVFNPLESVPSNLMNIGTDVDNSAM